MRHLTLTIFVACAALAPAAGAARHADVAAPADSGVVVEINAQGSAELADSRGTLRVFSGDVRVEYRAGGRGDGLDAGAVSLDGWPLRADTRKKGGTSYKA